MSKTPVPPYVSATDLSLGTRTGPVFLHVDLAFTRGSLAVVHGSAGSGRSSLLLLLSGRLKGWTGTARVAGLDVATQHKVLRQQVALARISHLVDLEGQLTVADCITERALTDGIQPDRAELVFRHAETLLDTRFDRDSLVDELTALDTTLLSVALATVRPAHVIVLDDADARLDLDQQRALLAALTRLTQTGVTMIIGTNELAALPPHAEIFSLPDPVRPLRKPA